MLKTACKIAWRTLKNNKGYTILHISGLSIGMAVALLIGIWIFFHNSFDKFLPGYERIYKTKIKFTYNGDLSVDQAIPLPLADAIMKDIPGVEHITRTDWMGPHGLMAGETKLYPSGAMADSNFLKVFQYPLAKGDLEKVLDDPYSIVLTESMAKALFGEADPMYKVVRIDNKDDLKVTGILKDLPKNSTFRFSYIVPFSYYIKANSWVHADAANWRDNMFQAYLSLKPNVSYGQIEPALKQLISRYDPQAYSTYHTEVFLQPMSDWHLYPDFKKGVRAGGLSEYMNMFGLIGIIVLLIACINFINLSTARSEKRAREVGVRKAIGSDRRSLIFQFLIEALLIAFFAALLALLVAQLALPFFNSLISNSIRIPYLSGIFWLVMLSYVLITGLLAGSRPAFYLSSFKPIEALKGRGISGKQSSSARKVLVVTQFTCSIALIICTIVVYQQISHAKNRDTGYDRDRLMITDVSPDLRRNHEALKNDLIQSGLVSSVSMSSSPVTAIWGSNNISQWQGKLPDETLALATVYVQDADYFKTIGMTLKSGRNFKGDLSSDTFNVILNEAAVERMRFKEPLNQLLTWKDNPRRVMVIGTVKNALMKSPFAPAEPTMFIYADADWASVISYRLSPRVSATDAIAKLGPIFNKYNPSSPYTYQFVDETYSQKFNMETLIGKLAGFFALLAIFISSLGLFGLAAYMAEQRDKEISIRKVMGASVSQIWVLLSKDFIALVLISCLIGSPIALYVLHEWLQKYPYRVNISVWVFVFATLTGLFITIVTISFQAIKTALANPVKSLRSP